MGRNVRGISTTGFRYTNILGYGSISSSSTAPSSWSVGNDQPVPTVSALVPRPHRTHFIRIPCAPIPLTINFYAALAQKPHTLCSYYARSRCSLCFSTALVDTVQLTLPISCRHTSSSSEPAGCRCTSWQSDALENSLLPHCAAVTAALSDCLSGSNSQV